MLFKTSQLEELLKKNRELQILLEQTRIELNVLQHNANLKKTDDEKGWKELFSELLFLIRKAQDTELLFLSNRQQRIFELALLCDNSNFNRNGRLLFVLFHYLGHISKFENFNLGDYVQTFAVETVLKDFYPEADYTFWDRDSLSFYPPTINTPSHITTNPYNQQSCWPCYLNFHHNGKFQQPASHENDNGARRNSFCIMQGWFSHSLNFLPNNLNPIWFGTHFSPTIKPVILEVLNANPKYFGPDAVGCRDTGTKNFLSSLLQPSYLSRCTTLLFDKCETVFDKTGNPYTNVFLVDFPESFLAYLPDYVLQNASIINQKCVKSEYVHWKHTYQRAKELLKTYQEKASLVITTALHCAAPCLAMGIPVILIAESPSENLSRFSALTGLLNIYTLDDLKDGKINFNNIKPSSFEDLKSAMKLNLGYTISLRKGERVDTNELRALRDYIENFTC